MLARYDVDLPYQTVIDGLWTVDGFRLGLVPTPAYRRNICPSRLWSHRVLARRWRALAAAEETPDVVIASSPRRRGFRSSSM